MRHRGPDDAGSFTAPGVWLGHRRLSIIDVSDRGHQPLEDPDTGAVLIFNGEIFNYLELRKQLEAHGHRFRSHSDTEVLLRAYVHWGHDCVGRLNGMWAFVIWDPRERSAFFSRDRFGIKPLFFAHVGGDLALASEPKALLALYPQLRRPDAEAIGRLLAEKRMYVDGRSFYTGISAFPAAHSGTFAPGDSGPAVERYWDFPRAGGAGTVGWPEAQRQFEQLFDSSVALRLRSDVPLALTLSGGLDSTAILHATSRGLGPRAAVRAYTSVYEELGPDGSPIDERVSARLALAPYAGSILREIAAPVDDLLTVLRQIVWHMDGPGFSPAVFPVWRIMRAVRADGVKVVLEGQGADEMLGGYASHLAAAILDALATGLRQRSASALGQAARAARTIPGAFSLRRVLGDMVAELVAPARRWDQRRSTVLQALRPELLPLERPRAPAGCDGRSRLERRLLSDFCLDLLPAFLHYGDAISMAHSVESRLPFLDHRLVELCFRLPADHKVRDGSTKAILRAYLCHAGQEQIAGVRRKRGYPTPSSKWLAGDDGAVLRDVLLDPGARTRDYVERPALERLIARHAGGMLAAGDVLFGLLCTELWLETCAGAASANSFRG